MSTSPNEPRIPELLAADLRRVYQAQVQVPAELDQAMLELARRTDLAKPRPARIRPWTLVKWAGVAAAVVAAFIVPTQLSPRNQQRPAVLAHSGDVNGDGAIDILDAFALARAARDGDTSITKQDIDAATTAAVRLTPLTDRGGGA